MLLVNPKRSGEEVGREYPQGIQIKSDRWLTPGLDDLEVFSNLNDSVVVPESDATVEIRVRCVELHLLFEC